MIAIINYDAGNLKSVQNALNFLGKQYFIAESPKQLEKADLILLPGVGAAKPAMEKLRNTGFAEYLRNTKTPVLGICLGMQLMAEYSEEGNVQCLGVIPGTVKRFEAHRSSAEHKPESIRENIKIPHMGWNTIIESHPPKGEQLFYFVHSYYFDTRPEYTLATCEYGKTFAAIVQHNNYTGIQFHPEKSGTKGLQLLNHFIEKGLS